MMVDVTAYRRTKYRNVYWRGDSLYYRVRDASGRWREVHYGTGTAKDCRDAQEIAQERANAVRHGVVDPRLDAIERYANGPVSELVAEYRAHLQAKRDSRQHVATTIRLIERWSAACAVHRLADADAHRLNRWLTEQTAWSARTRNAARTAVLGLCRWASDYGRIAFNPCPPGLVMRANEDADRKRLSRALSVAEFTAAIGQAPAHRRAFYLLAGCTGLRWLEIGRLTWGDVDLEAGTLTAQAGQTKNDRRADLPLPRAVADALADHHALQTNRTGKRPLPGDRIFKAVPRIKTWKQDLARAGVAYADSRGRQADRKCLRMTFATWLRDAGVDLRDAQRLMRHSDPKLTANIYTDLRISHLRAASDAVQQHFNKHVPDGDASGRIVSYPVKDGTSA